MKENGFEKGIIRKKDRIVYECVGKMKGKNQTIVRFFELRCKKIQKLSKKVQKRY